MYSSFVTLHMADFCGPGKSAWVFVCFPGLNSRRTKVFRTDGRPWNLARIDIRQGLYCKMCKCRFSADYVFYKTTISECECETVLKPSLGIYRMLFWTINSWVNRDPRQSLNAEPILGRTLLDFACDIVDTKEYREKVFSLLSLILKQSRCLFAVVQYHPRSSAVRTAATVPSVCNFSPFSRHVNVACSV
jgi:hypothetical protein